MEIITREQAKDSGLKKYFTGEPCKHGHICERYTCDGKCRVCSIYYTQNWVRKNKEHRELYNKNYLKAWRQNPENKEYQKKYIKKWTENNRQRSNEHKKRWRDKNPGNASAWAKNNRKRSNEIKRKWRQNNKEKERNYRRRWSKTDSAKFRNLVSATTKKLNVGRFYKPKKYFLSYTVEEYSKHLLSNFPHFSTLREAFAMGYEVDHIVPLKFIENNIENKILRFKVAMDLNNLQLLTKIENLRKLNRIDSPIVQENIKYLWDKYGIPLPEEFREAA